MGKPPLSSLPGFLNDFPAGEITGDLQGDASTEVGADRRDLPIGSSGDFTHGGDAVPLLDDVFGLNFVDVFHRASY